MIMSSAYKDFRLKVFSSKKKKSIQLFVVKLTIINVYTAGI